MIDTIMLALTAASATITVVTTCWALHATGQRDAARDLWHQARAAEREWRNEALTARCVASREAGVRSALASHARQMQLEQQRARREATTAALKVA